MNPGLVVKLRPTGPWRIGPDSGARNRVDVIYHSDSLYSAVTTAMAELGRLEGWLDETARRGGEAAVRFSSCFPFQDELGFVVPPRTIWPPTSPSLTRVRWRSARFVPLGIVQALLAGQMPDDNHWWVDGPSECLVPLGKPGPFRTAVRTNAAVDRLTGASERHSTACLEFRPGAGLWTIVSFHDDDASKRWAGPVRSAFRLLADTGFGGERSRGWGRAEAPEFVEGALPDMILPRAVEPAEPAVAQAELRAPSVQLPARARAPQTETESAPVAGAKTPEPAPAASVDSEPQPEPAAEPTPPPDTSPSAEPAGAEPQLALAAESTPPPDTSSAAKPAGAEPEPPLAAGPVGAEPQPALAAELTPLPDTSSAAEPAGAEPQLALVAESTPPPDMSSAAEPAGAEPQLALVAESTPPPDTSSAAKPAGAEPEPPLAAGPVGAEPQPALAAELTPLPAASPAAEPAGAEPQPAPAAEPIGAEPQPALAAEPTPPPEAALVEPERPLGADVTLPGPEAASAAEPAGAEPSPPPAVSLAAEGAPVESQQPVGAEVTPKEPAAPPAVESAGVDEPGSAQPAAPATDATAPEPAVAPAPAAVPSAPTSPHWLLSLFTPAAGDDVDWSRGDYTVITRGGRIQSPTASGDLKKQLNMITEGSVIFATTGLRGDAPNVAPDGFPHPVFRGGFALSIPLPGEVR